MSSNKNAASTDRCIRSINNSNNVVTLTAIVTASAKLVRLLVDLGICKKLSSNSKSRSVSRNHYINNSNSNSAYNINNTNEHNNDNTKAIALLRIRNSNSIGTDSTNRISGHSRRYY